MIRRKENMETMDRPQLWGGEGVVHCYKMLETEEMGGKVRTCAINTLEPGCSIGIHAHGPDAEIYYVLEGEVQAWDNGQETVLHIGDAMYTGGGHTRRHCGQGAQDIHLGHGARRALDLRHLVGGGGAEGAEELVLQRRDAVLGGQDGVLHVL